MIDPSVQTLATNPEAKNPEAKNPEDVLSLAQTMAEQSRISEKDWHRLKSNRRARAQEQMAMAMVFLLKNNPEQALAHLQQATGWLDRSISAPPCPSHGNQH